MAEWWRGAVMYQIYPRSFLDTNGDGIGDLAGITARLDYVAGLGVDGIWLSPFAKSPMKDFGYDVSDYCDVDPLFGTLDDFDRLLRAAHDRGLKVIMDMVLSHTSDRHPWFQESRASRGTAKADWYVWADAKPDGTPPNNWLSVFGGSSWQWDTRRQQYYLHNFLASQPDLNLHNPDVVDAVFDAVAFWLDRGVDGFRLDTANFYLHDPQLRDNPPRPPSAGNAPDVPLTNPYGRQYHVYDKSRPENLEFLRKLRRVLDRYPDRMTVGEVACDAGVKRIAEYCAGNDLLHTAYSFDLLSPGFSAAKIRGAVTAFFDEPGGGWPAWAFSNHDVIRAVTRWGGDSPAGASAALAKQLLALLTSLPGTPFLYQGEELALPEAEIAFEDLQDPYGIEFWPVFKGRDGCRTPMPWQHDAPAGGFSTGKPWLPVVPAHLERAVSRQEGDPASPLAFARSFLRWRKTRPALIHGRASFFDTPEPLLAFERKTAGERLLCLFNLGADPARWTPPAVALTPLDTGAAAHGLQGRLENGSVLLPGHGIFHAVLDR